MHIRRFATALLATALLGGCVTGYQPYRAGVGSDYYGRPVSGYGYGAPYGSVGYGYPGAWSGGIGYGAGYGYGLSYGFGYGSYGYPYYGYGYPYYGYGYPYYGGYYPSHYHPNYPRNPPRPETRPRDPRPGYSLPDNDVRYPSRAQQALRQPPQPKEAGMVDGRVDTTAYPSRYRQLQGRPDAVMSGGGAMRGGANVAPPPPMRSFERSAPSRTQSVRPSMPVERAPVRSSGRGAADDTPY